MILLYTRVEDEATYEVWGDELGNTAEKMISSWDETHKKYFKFPEDIQEYNNAN